MSKTNRILIVDDDDGWFDIISSILEDLYCYDRAKNTKDAIDAIEKLKTLYENNYMLICSNYKIKNELEGRKFLFYLKEKQIDIPVILITGNSSLSSGLYNKVHQRIDIIKKRYSMIRKVLIKGDDDNFNKNLMESIDDIVSELNDHPKKERLILDRKNKELLSKKADDIKNNKELTKEEIQLIISKLHEQKKIPEIDSISLFLLSWISEQSRTFNQLLPVSEMVLALLHQKREHEKNPVEHNFLLKLESRLIEDINKYKEKLSLGENDENEKRLLFERIQLVVRKLKNNDILV